jgi:hypothetical protein
VWIEEAGAARGMRSAVLYVVGQREGRALLEVVEVPSARGLDLPRALSLKLGELLHELRSNRAAPFEPHAAALSRPPLTASGDAAATEPQPPAVELMPESELESDRFWAAGRVGARFDSGLGTKSGRVGLGADLTPEWTRGRLRVALGVGADWFPQLSRDSAQGSVRLTEVAPRVLAALAWRTSLCDLGVHTAGLLGLLSARGRTPLGRIGDSRERVFGWALGVHAERNLWGPLGVVLFVEAQTQAERLRLQVNGDTVLDRGRLRVTWGLDLLLRSALTPTPP